MNKTGFRASSAHHGSVNNSGLMEGEDAGRGREKDRFGQALRWIIRLGVPACVLLCAGALYVFWQFDRSPVNMDKLKKLSAGASEQEVVAIIGKPQSIFSADRTWAYSRPLAWPIVYIYFDESNRFTRFEYDR
jgi:hypothetical protein